MCDNDESMTPAPDVRGSCGSCSNSAPDPLLVITHPKDDVFWPLWAHLSNPEPPAQQEQSSQYCKGSQKAILPLCFIRGKRWRKIGICSLATTTSAAGLSLITLLLNCDIWGTLPNSKWRGKLHSRYWQVTWSRCNKEGTGRVFWMGVMMMVIWKPRCKCHLWDVNKTTSCCLLVRPPVKEAKVYGEVSFPNISNHMCNENADGVPN